MGFNKPTSDVNSLMGGTKANSSGMGGGVQTDIQPINKPQGKKPRPKSPSATFLGNDAEPGMASGNFGGKTLLGT